MRKKISGFHLWAWALCLGVMGGPTVQAQETAGTVYIQGSEVNLRTGAGTTGEVVQKVLIGTGCQRLNGVDKKGWVRVRCGDAEGFTLDKLLGPEKPNLEALLAQARDTAKSARERLDAAMRAATLEPQNEQASQLLATLFFDVNFEQLAKEQKKGGLHESFLVLCNRGRQQQPETHEQCLTNELERIEYDWHQLSIREDRFVSAMFREGALVVYTGHLRSRARGRFDPEDDEFNIIVESRSKTQAADALKSALQQGAHVPEPDKNRYRAFEEESPDTPALSPDAYKIFKALPGIWYKLEEQSGKKFILVNCGAIHGNVLRVDLHRRASLYRGDLPQGEFPGSVMRIKNLSKSEAEPVYSIQLTERGDRKPTSLTINWPTDEPGVSTWKTETQWNGQPYSAIERYSINKGAPNEIRRQDCYQGKQ